MRTAAFSQALLPKRDGRYPRAVPTNTTVRFARPEDALTIIEFVRGLAVFERESPERVHLTPEAILRDGFGDRPAFESLIAEQDGRPVGFALFFPNYSTWEGSPGLYCEDLFVAEEARGTGAGEALLPVPTIVTVSAWTRTGNDAYSALVNTPLQGVVVNVPGVGTRTTDQNGEFTIDIAAPVTVSLTSLDGTHYAPIRWCGRPSRPWSCARPRWSSPPRSAVAAWR